MKLQVLGCHGGELPKCRTTCFLVDGVLALDAGALTGTLDARAAAQGRRHRPHAQPLRPREGPAADGGPDRRAGATSRSPSTRRRECAKTLRENMFNDALWPDFTRIPTKKNPVLQLQSLQGRRARFKIGQYTVQLGAGAATRWSPAASSSPTAGTALAMSGDTGPTEKLWKLLNQTPEPQGAAARDQLPQRAAGARRHLRPPHAADAAGRAGEVRAQRQPRCCSTTSSRPSWPQLKRQVEGLPVRGARAGRHLRA